MRKMINGLDSTLENWLKTTTFILGKDSDAVLFLEELIDSRGEKEEVTINERAFIKLLFHLHLSVFCYDVPLDEGANRNANMATGPAAIAAAAALYAESYNHVTTGAIAFIGMGANVNSCLGAKALVDNGGSANAKAVVGYTPVLTLLLIPNINERKTY